VNPLVGPGGVKSGKKETESGGRRLSELPPCGGEGTANKNRTLGKREKGRSIASRLEKGASLYDIQGKEK